MFALVNWKMSHASGQLIGVYIRRQLRQFPADHVLRRHSSITKLHKRRFQHTEDDINNYFRQHTRLTEVCECKVTQKAVFRQDSVCRHTTWNESIWFWEVPPISKWVSDEGLTSPSTNYKLDHSGDESFQPITCIVILTTAPEKGQKHTKKHKITKRNQNGTGENTKCTRKTTRIRERECLTSAILVWNWSARSKI